MKLEMHSENADLHQGSALSSYMHGIVRNAPFNLNPIVIIFCILC